MKITRRIAIAATTCTLVTTLGLAACGETGTPAVGGSQETATVEEGPNVEEAIRTGITAELDLLKDPTKKNLAAYMGDVEGDTLSTLDAYGIDMYEMLAHLLSKFDYSVGDISVEGNTATAQVTVTNVDIPAAMQAATDTMGTPETSERLAEIYNANDDQALMQAVIQIIYDAVDSTEGVVSTDTELTLTNTKGTWTIDQASLDELISGIYGGLDLSSLG